MSTSRPFAYNTGTTISGTEQVGNLAIGVDNENYSSNYGGVRWWNGPDEDLGYVICQQVPGNTQPTPNSGETASVGFWRTIGKTDGSFIELAEYITIQDGTPQTFATADDAEIWLTNNGYWTSYTIPPTPSVTPSQTFTPTPSITPTNTITPTVTSTTTNTPSVTPTQPIGVTFSQSFVSGQAPSASVENAWTTFRSQLTGTYSKMILSNNLGSSLTVTDPKVDDIATALNTATTGTNFTVVIGANTWRVAHGCVSGTPDANSIYLTNSGVCDCGGTYTVRPMIKNANWGGINSGSCNSSSQIITLTFQ